MNKAFEKILERLEDSLLNITFQTNERNKGFNDGIHKARETVHEVAEEYKGGWIPCSEKLPEYGEVVMCSCTNSGITISCITHKGVKPSKSVRFGQHSVIAWQPLPEPFKERD